MGDFGTDLSQKGQKQGQIRQNRARNWKECKKSKPKANTSLNGPTPPGLERQPDDAAGAPRAVEDAPAVNEYAQADPAPVQAPQPPPPTPRTILQRIARLEEEVQELRRSIVGL
ncbi:hypothetical protein Tco_1376157 [Tanacetum coccineum]